MPVQSNACDPRSLTAITDHPLPTSLNQVPPLAAVSDHHQYHHTQAQTPSHQSQQIDRLPVPHHRAIQTAAKQTAANPDDRAHALENAISLLRNPALESTLITTGEAPGSTPDDHAVPTAKTRAAPAHQKVHEGARRAGRGREVHTADRALPWSETQLDESLLVRLNRRESGV